MVQLFALALLLAQAAAPAATGQQAHVSAATVPSTPAARVQGNHVVHRTERATVRVPRSARFVGSERFKLYGVADAEIHLFAEVSPGKRLRRLYWIQFESYLPDAMTRGYDYADNARHLLWGTPTWVRAGPAATGATPRPESDGARVRTKLERAGITLPREALNLRMVQLLDDPQGSGKGMRELMIIYSEDLALTGKTLAELTTDGKPNGAWKAMEQPLIERATKAVTIKRH